MKKKWLILLAFALVIALLAFGGSDEKPAQDAAEEEEEYVPWATMPENPVKMTGETISVYNWGDYVEPEIIDIFEAETGIRVIYETFETNEDMYAKIAMGGSSYDVIVPSDYMIERMIQERLLQPINWDNVPNVKNINPRFMGESYDPEAEYAVPYTWGTMGILYNTE
ncbi:MAG: extracellular solute-binding protein, partial [Eubacteriales bacterium]|nr:extracellular solute-binding protein [Eubacteriales bacterium]